MLSENAVEQILLGTTSENIKPVLQVLEIKNVVGQGAKTNQRCRLSLTDGTKIIFGILPKNDVIINESIKMFSLIRVEKFVINQIQDQTLIVLLSVVPVGHMEMSLLRTSAPAPQISTVGRQAAPPSLSTGVYTPNYGAVSASNFSAVGNQNVNPQTSYNMNAAQNSIPKPQHSNYQAPASNAYGTNLTSPSGYRPIKKDDNEAIVPISAISPYSNRWTIKARITSKSELRSWSNAKGTGTVFSIDLIDKESTEIRATFFKEACDKFYHLLEESKVYTFSGGKLKLSDPKNKAFTTIKNPYELTFDVHSEIRAASDQESSIKSVNYNFTPIGIIHTIEPNTSIDVIGVIRASTEPSSIISTKLGGKSLIKRELTIVDQTNAEIRLTIWGEKASSTAYDWGSNPIVAFKGVKVGEFGGRSLSTATSTVMTFDPMVMEADVLRNWRSQFHGIIPAGNSLSSGTVGGMGGASFDKRKPISSIKDDNLGMNEKPDYIDIKSTVNYIKHDNEPWYAACPKCSKKVVDTSFGWQCDKCNESHNQPHRRYIMSITMGDASGQTWFSLFNEQAEKLLNGVTAEELNEMKARGDEEGYERVFTEALFKTYVARIRVKQEIMNDEKRVKSTVFSLTPLDLTSECRSLIEAISRY